MDSQERRLQKEMFEVQPLATKDKEDIDCSERLSALVKQMEQNNGGVHPSRLSIDTYHSLVTIAQDTQQSSISRREESAGTLNNEGNLHIKLTSDISDIDHSKLLKVSDKMIEDLLNGHGGGGASEERKRLKVNNISSIHDRRKVASSLKNQRKQRVDVTLSEQYHHNQRPL